MPTPTHKIYTLSLHDALPISNQPTYSSMSSTLSIVSTFQIGQSVSHDIGTTAPPLAAQFGRLTLWIKRSEEHTSELQSLRHLVCRLLLEKKKTNIMSMTCRTR